MSYTIGSITFNTPILNASGCWSSSEEQLVELYNSQLAGIVAKTCTIFCKEGNLEPNYYEVENKNIYFNSKGLPNLGYQYYKNLALKFNQKPFIISIAYENLDKLKILLRDYESYIKSNMLVEINLSCPNTENEIPGYNKEFLESLLIYLFCLKLEKIKFGFKLPPYFQKQEIGALCKIFNDCPSVLAYIVVSNSIPNCLPVKESNTVLSTKFGGMSGKMNKYIALGNVSLFSENLSKEIKIVGCGGIETIEDINDYLNYGADFVQLASCFYNSSNNKLNIEKINNLINNYLKK
jgi:dihydroorotate dehydrogenase (fumarate)